jgi:restriction system protein
MTPTSSRTPLKAVWAIRAGKKGEADELFLKHGRIVLSDPGLGDLSNLTSERAAFYTAYRALHPDDTRTGSAGIAGKFFRFVHEIEIGDLVLYPSLKDKQVYIGELTGKYVFDESLCSKFPHVRSVRWRYLVPKADLSKKTQQELGAARTFFKFQRHVDEIMEMITQKRVKRFATSKKAE